MNCPIFWSILVAAPSSFSGSEQFSRFWMRFLFLSRDSLTKESSSSSMITAPPNVTYIYFRGFDSRPCTETSKRVTSEQDVLFILEILVLFVLDVSIPSQGTSSSLNVLDNENKAVSCCWRFGDRNCFDGDSADLTSSSDLILIKPCEFSDNFGIRDKTGGNYVDVNGDKEFWSIIYNQDISYIRFTKFKVVFMVIFKSLIEIRLHGGIQSDASAHWSDFPNPLGSLIMVKQK